MPGVDMPLAELEAYAPAPNPPDDLGEFWDRTLSDLQGVDPQFQAEPRPLPFPGLTAAAVTYRGLGGGEVTGWSLRHENGGRQPGLLVCHGYSGRAPRPIDLLPFALAGFTVLSVDCRGQMGGSGPVPAKGYIAGWMTEGLESPDTYYYRYVYADMVRGMELLGRMEGVDPERLAVTGISQGGGLSLAVAALSGAAQLVWSDIPFLCDFRRSVAIVEKHPYSEISDLLRQRPELADVAFKTLSYFDVLNLADRINCRTFITVGLWDDVCPPSSVYAVFHQLSANQKELIVLPYHRHEVDYQLTERRLAALADLAAHRP